MALYAVRDLSILSIEKEYLRFKVTVSGVNPFNVNYRKITLFNVNSH
jgi:hypothetical protein